MSWFKSKKCIVVGGSINRKVIATLAKDELTQVINGERLLADHASIYQLMVQGQRALWFTFRKKYGLPEDIDYDPKTGEIFAKDK